MFLQLKKLEEVPSIWLKTQYLITTCTNNPTSAIQIASFLISELKGKGHEPSQAENSSAQATARASSARAHHYHLELHIPSICVRGPLNSSVINI